MISRQKNYEISWAQFEACNSNPQDAFEKMCRLLFNDFFFEGKALLHSDPNNPGVEVVPQLHSASNKRISFQAKFFSSMNYAQIKHSANMAISHYKGDLDIIYLYCNKDVSISSKAYQEIETNLNAEGIEIKPITDQEILEQVMKNETVAWHFFDQISLSHDWFYEQLHVSLASLGPRYNDKFNVSTKSEELLNYFLCNVDAVAEINKVKNDEVKNLRNRYRQYRGCQEIFEKVLKRIELINDITLENILVCLSWSKELTDTCANEFAQISELIEIKNQQWGCAESKKDYDLMGKISEDIDALTYLLKLPQLIMPGVGLRPLLKNQTLIVKGNAGVGKSQMFAVAAEKLVRAGNSAIILLGNSF